MQNALNAMRCKMYLDLRSQNQPQPDYPTQVVEHIRKRYQSRIAFEEEDALF
jgi:hypothetical protein